MSNSSIIVIVLPCDYRIVVVLIKFPSCLVVLVVVARVFSFFVVLRYNSFEDNYIILSRNHLSSCLYLCSIAFKSLYIVLCFLSSKCITLLIKIEYVVFSFLWHNRIIYEYFTFDYFFFLVSAGGVSAGEATFLKSSPHLSASTGSYWRSSRASLRVTTPFS